MRSRREGERTTQSNVRLASLLHRPIPGARVSRDAKEGCVEERSREFGGVSTGPPESRWRKGAGEEEPTARNKRKREKKKDEERERTGKSRVEQTRPF